MPLRMAMRQAGLDAQSLEPRLGKPADGQQATGAPAQHIGPWPARAPRASADGGFGSITPAALNAASSPTL